MRLRSVLAVALAALTIAACRPEPIVEQLAGVDHSSPPTTSTTVRPRPPHPAPTTTTTAAPRRRGGGSGGGGGGSSSSPSPTTTSTTATTTPPSTTTAPPSNGGTVLWRSTEGWQAEQEPAVLGAVQQDRIRMAVDPEKGAVMRAELRPFGSAPGLRDGDVTTTGGYEANRSEVYARHASPGSTPAAQWPDPIGATRWYGFDLYIPQDFVTDPTGLQWITITQWKGYAGGSPPIALEIKRDRLEMAGKTGRQDLGPIKRGTWERIVVGVYLHPDAGWVEVYRDGQQALARTNRPTMEWRSPGVVDPIYLKQGIYRHWDWRATHVLYFGPVTIGTTRDVVL